MADQEQQIATEQPAAVPTPDDAPAPATDAPVAHAETPTEEDVYEALEEVIDPELGLDFVSLGLVYDVHIDEEAVYVTFTLTTPACPIGPQVSEQMREFVGDLPGVSAVHPKMVFDPAWSPEIIDEDAQLAPAAYRTAPAQAPRGSAPSRVQWKTTVQSHEPCPSGTRLKRLIACWPPSWSPYRRSTEKGCGTPIVSISARLT